MSRAVITPVHCRVVTAMVADGWSDAQIGAAMRAAAMASNATVAPPEMENATVVESGFAANGEMRKWANCSALAAKGDPMLLKASFEIAPGLSRTQRAIGVALVDKFYNRKSRRCDPSAAKIAIAAGCNRASVFRAFPRFEALGLMRRARYAGKYHTSLYDFDFECAAGLVRVWQQSQNNENATVKGQKPLQQSQSIGANATQTQIDININSSPRGELQRRSKSKPVDRRQVSMMLPISGGRTSPDHAEVAQEAAQKRLWNDLQKRFGKTPAFQHVTELSMTRQDDWAAALRAEMLRHGSGVSLFIDRINGPRTAGIGPP